MSFLSPELLWILMLLPALPALYIFALRRRKVGALRFSNLDAVKEAVGNRTSIRRHLPPAMVFVALAVMIAGLARPTTILTLPSERSIVILAMDVSGSMRAADVNPDRMTAAKSAARGFVKDQPRSTRIGLVAFSTSAMITQDPTVSHDDIISAIDSLRPQRFTAVGSGLVASLQAIFPDGEIQVPLSARNRDRERARPLADVKGPEPKKPAEPVPPGSYTSAVIILLSDGRTNAGVDPLDAARMAADRGIRVFTVGFGTSDGSVVDFGGGMMRTQLDEETLKAIAELTGGRYFHATTEEDLKEAYKSLTTQFVAETKRTEITAAAAAIAGLLLFLAAMLSLRWSSRMA